MNKLKYKEDAQYLDWKKAGIVWCTSVKSSKNSMSDHTLYVQPLFRYNSST